MNIRKIQMISVSLLVGMLAVASQAADFDTPKKCMDGFRDALVKGDAVKLQERFHFSKKQTPLVKLRCEMMAARVRFESKMVEKYGADWATKAGVKTQPTVFNKVLEQAWLDKLEYKVEGDTATATHPEDVAAKRTGMTLTKVDGNWKIDLSMMLPLDEQIDEAMIDNTKRMLGPITEAYKTTIDIIGKEGETPKSIFVALQKNKQIALKKIMQEMLKKQQDDQID